MLLKSTVGKKKVWLLFDFFSPSCLNATMVNICIYFPSTFQIYMFAEWYKPGSCLEYPLHGSGAVVNALVQGLQKFGGRISLGSHVQNIIVENDRAVGVKLKSGQVNFMESIRVNV